MREKKYKTTITGKFCNRCKIEVGESSVKEIDGYFLCTYCIKDFVKFMSKNPLKVR